jgi:hypothetical protein
VLVGGDTGSIGGEDITVGEVGELGGNGVEVGGELGVVLVGDEVGELVGLDGGLETGLEFGLDGPTTLIPSFPQKLLPTDVEFINSAPQYSVPWWLP